MRHAGGHQERLSAPHYDGNNAAPQVTIQTCDIPLNDVGGLWEKGGSPVSERDSILSCAETFWKNICS